MRTFQARCFVAKDLMETPTFHDVNGFQDPRKAVVLGLLAAPVAMLA
jgi:hypothetical protein